MQQKNIVLNNTTAYLAGVIVGDGHISAGTKSKHDKSTDYRLVLETIDAEHLDTIYRMITSLINTKSVIKAVKPKPKRQPSQYLQIRNKSLHIFFTTELGIPSGNKCFSVRIPPKIMKSGLVIQGNFLAGLFDSDGGFRGKSIGFTSASKGLIDDVHYLFDRMKIKHGVDSWTHSKYERRYYGIKLSSKEIDNFLNSFHLRNPEKIRKIKARFYAGMPERSNGTDNSDLLESVQA